MRRSGNHFARKVGQFFEVPHVLQQHGAAAACGDHVLVVPGTGAPAAVVSLDMANSFRGEEGPTRVRGVAGWVFCYRFVVYYFFCYEVHKAGSHSISPSRS